MMPHQLWSRVTELGLELTEDFIRSIFTRSLYQSDFARLIRITFHDHDVNQQQPATPESSPASPSDFLADTIPRDEGIQRPSTRTPVSTPTFHDYDVSTTIDRLDQLGASVTSRINIDADNPKNRSVQGWTPRGDDK